MLYQQPVALDKSVHRLCGVRAPQGYRFAAAVNSVPLALSEFDAAAAWYPIVLLRDRADAVFPVAVLGLERGRNAWVDAAGNWVDDAYIPAWIRRYPFVLGRRAGEQQASRVCVDAPALTSAGGEPLFDAQGQATRYLDDARRFLARYQRELLAARAFGVRLHALSLLRPLQLERAAEGLRRRCHVVDTALLERLPDHDLLTLCRSDAMRALYLHTFSLRHLNRLG